MVLADDGKRLLSAGNLVVSLSEQEGRGGGEEPVWIFVGAASADDRKHFLSAGNLASSLAEQEKGVGGGTARILTGNAFQVRGVRH